MRALTIRALICSFLAVATSASQAAYVANFSTTGAASDFAVMNGVDNTTANAFTVESGGGNPFLNISATAAAATGPQMRFQIAPSNLEGVEIALPTGMSGTVPRTEARLSVKISSITGADDLPAENPFTQFGFAEFNPVTNTPDYASKIIIQISNTLNQVTLGYTTENAASGTNTMATFNIPGGTYVAGDSLELQVNENQARLLYNGSPMMTGGVGTDYKNLPVNFFSANFASGNQLIPFFGVIRGAVLEAGDTIGAGFDDINARNVTLGAGVVGDANGDGEVTFADVQLIASKFREAVPQGTLGDLNANGQVDFDDFHIWKTAANSTISFGEALASIPEPSTGTLLVVAAACGAIVRRQRLAM